VAPKPASTRALGSGVAAVGANATPANADWPVAVASVVAEPKVPTPVVPLERFHDGCSGIWQLATETSSAKTAIAIAATDATRKLNPL
jgi:hypothetical protein